MGRTFAISVGVAAAFLLYLEFLSSGYNMLVAEAGGLVLVLFVLGYWAVERARGGGGETDDTALLPCEAEKLVYCYVARAAASGLSSVYVPAAFVSVPGVADSLARDGFAVSLSGGGPCVVSWGAISDAEDRAREAT